MLVDVHSAAGDGDGFLDWFALQLGDFHLVDASGPEVEVPFCGECCGDSQGEGLGEDQGFRGDCWFVEDCDCFGGFESVQYGSVYVWRLETIK